MSDSVAPIANIRNVKSPHWRRGSSWTLVENPSLALAHRVRRRRPAPAPIADAASAD